MPNGAKNWCFTLNNFTNDEHTRITTLPDQAEGLVSYLVVGREHLAPNPTGGQPGLAGAGGLAVGGATPHLQGYVQFSQRVALARCRRLISNRAHFEVARGTPREAAEYCKKEGDFFEWGAIKSTQGKRNDWDDLKEFVLAAGHVPSDRDLAANFPALYSRSSKLKDICAAFLPAPVLVEGTPRAGWQSTIAGMVMNPCVERRKVFFFVDYVGNKGKSWMCAYLISKYPERVQVLSSGKRDDLALTIDETKDVFLFDIPRGGLDFLQYSILEKLKDRMIFSPKYCSTVKVLQKLPHVIVFCNEDPDQTKMSVDRYDITICGDNHLFVN